MDGTVAPITSIVTLNVPGTTADGIVCTGGEDLVLVLPVDVDGGFAFNSARGEFPTDPLEVCLSSDNGSAVSAFVVEK